MFNRISLSLFPSARSISDDLSSGDAARFRDDEYGKAETSGMGAAGSSARNESAHKGDKDKEKKEKDKEDRDEGESDETETNAFDFIWCLLFLVSPETIKVFDGNCSLRRRIFRAITVARTCTLEQLLTTALRAFHIAREPSVSLYMDSMPPLAFNTPSVSRSNSI